MITNIKNEKISKINVSKQRPSLFLSPINLEK